MRLFLIRHGEANPESIDPSRSLTKKGIEDSVTIGKFLSSLRIRPDYLFSSDKSRAMKTADIIAKLVGSEENELIVSRDLHPNSYPEAMGSLISSYGSAETVIVIGHLPSIGIFTSYLITAEGFADSAISFDTCTIAYLEGDDVTKPGGFMLKALISPGLI